MPDNKKKPVPFSAEAEFISYIDEMAERQSVSRSGLIRHALKTFGKEHYPQVFTTFFPGEAPVVEQVPVAAAPEPVTRPIPKRPPGVHVSRADDDFLDNITPIDTHDDHNYDEDTTYGAPDQCPSCQIPREHNGKINVVCSTNPNRGKWICNECSAAGEYFPNKPATINN